jgi:hypothetical protein
LAALPHPQNVVNLGHSLEFPFLHLFVQFRVVFYDHGMQFRVNSCQNPVMSWSKLPYDDFFPMGLASGF